MKVLIATDGSKFSLAAVKKAAGMLPNTAETEIKILSVYEHAVLTSGEPFGVLAEYHQEAENLSRKVSENAVADAAALLAEAVPAAKFSVSTEIGRGNSARVILEFAAEWNADVIVMGSHGYGFWERNLLGSVSDSVVHHAPCSVMIIRGQVE